MTISYIQLNDGQDPHPIDAMTVGTKSISEIGELVTSIDSSSTDTQYPSAKCIYDMVYGSPTLPEHDYSKDYLTFEALEDTTFKFTRNSLEYSVDDGNTWVNLPAGTNTPTVASGNKIMFKKTNPSISTSYGIGTFSSTGKFNVSGNIMSLFYGDDFDGQISLSGKNYVFYKLFYNCKNVISASNLILPATTLASYCYSSMFEWCTSLTTAPELPATTLVNDCYYSMFRSCTSLTTAPELPATTLSYECYCYMFYDCTSLTTAPELPATTLTDNCYNSMFYGCTSLTTAPALPATTLADGCYGDMFIGCTSLTTVPSNLLPATTLAMGCYTGMFWNCTSLTIAPELPATTLADRCYENMFYGCTSLTTVPALPATNLKGNCYYQMFIGCTSLNYIKCLATDISAANCTLGWVDGVASTGTFVKAADMTSWTTGVSGIPQGWTVEEFDYTKEPLTFNILSDGTINWTASDASIAKTIEYKLNNGEWTSITSNTGSSAPTITVNSGDKVQFRGNNATYSDNNFRPNSSTFGNSTAGFEVEGNIMSLIYGDNFKNNSTISSTHTFYGLFKNCANLVSAENLILPATTLVLRCYSKMFYGCTKLTTAPVLPATTLAQYCYGDMFCGCKNLTIAPELPATTLANACYDSMFYGCSSLTTAPELPAITLGMYCYQDMFLGCTNLNYIKCLATNISEYNCTKNWAANVASNGTFVKNPNMTSWTTGVNGIPTGWTVQNA